MQRLTRWAAFTGIVLLVLRRFLYARFPGVLPSRAWRPESWFAGLLLNGIFELILLALLLAVPFCVYRFRRAGLADGRDFAIDCAAVGALYLSALLLL
jgi:hypothetical protein